MVTRPHQPRHDSKVTGHDKAVLDPMGYDKTTLDQSLEVNQIDPRRAMETTYGIVGQHNPDDKPDIMQWAITVLLLTCRPWLSSAIPKAQWKFPYAEYHPNANRSGIERTHAIVTPNMIFLMRLLRDFFMLSAPKNNDATGILEGLPGQDVTRSDLTRRGMA